MFEPMICDLPYPTTDGICRDALSLQIISPAYATSVGELNAVLQYVYHSLFFDLKGCKEYVHTLMSIAVAEMMHLKLLGKTILALGAAPTYTQYPPSSFNFYSSKYVAYSCSLRNMLEDDIIGERKAISDYKKMLRCLKNEKVKEIVSRILQDEYLHLDALEKMLCELKC